MQARDQGGEGAREWVLHPYDRCEAGPGCDMGSPTSSDDSCTSAFSPFSATGANRKSRRASAGFSLPGLTLPGLTLKLPKLKLGRGGSSAVTAQQAAVHCWQTGGPPPAHPAAGGSAAPPAA